MKKLFITALGLLMAFSLFGIEVNEGEIKTDGNIEFINYTGTHSQVDTVDQIRAIGTQLGSAVTSGSAGNLGRYYVMHIVDANDTKGFDADIFVIGANAGVDHIANMRLIIAGYLQAAYKYSSKDAETIAHFVTVYNAVHRKDLKYFGEKYKQAVMKNLTSDKAGLAIHYSEWAGKTQIIIPLGDARLSKTISAIDTSTISSKEVVNKMREEKGKEIGVREDMINLKERESAEAAKRAEAAKKQAETEKKKADTAAKQAETEKKKADTAVKQAETAKKEADKKASEAEAAKKKAETTKSEADKAVAEKKAKEAEVAKKEADKKATEAEAAKKKADEKKQEAAKDQKLADTKEKEAQDDRKNVAADTQKILEEKAAEKKAESDAAIASAVPGYGLRVVDKTKMLSQLVLLDLKTAKELKASAVKNIHGRYLIDTEGRLMAIAGTTEGGGVITLVLFDPITLEVVKQGADNISEESVLVKNGDDYYAVLDNGGKYYIGRFNSDMKLQAKSSLQVQPYSPVTFVEEGIMVQTTDNSIRLIGLKDLLVPSN